MKYVQIQDEYTYRRQLDSEMREEDLLRTIPLLFCGGDLVGLELPLPEIGNSVDDNPRYTSAKVDDLRNPSIFN